MVTLDQTVSTTDLEERLKETESAIRSLEAATSAGRWAIDLTHGSLVGSEQLARIYGFDRLENLSMDSWLERVHPEDQEALRSALRESVSQQGQKTHQHRLLLDSGEVRHLRQIWLVHQQGDIPRFIKGVCIDETESSSEPPKKLRDKEILSELPLAAISLSSLGKIEYINPSAALLDIDCEFINGEFQIGQQPVWTNAMGYNTSQKSIEAVNRSGEKLLLDLWTTQSEDTTVVFMAQSGWVDETEDDYYREILDNLPLGVLICDGTANLLFVNTWMTCRRKEPEDQFHTWPRMFNARSQTPIHAADLPVNKVFATGEPALIDEIDVQFSESDRITMRCHIKPFRCEASDARRVQVVFEEIQLSVSETGSASSETDSADHAKRQFLSNMSHELRTPLNAMLGFQQLIQQSGELSSTQDQNLKLASQSGLRLLRVINDLIEISRIETTETDIKPTAFAVVDFIREVQQEHTGRCRQKGLAFTADIAADIPDRINTDRDKLFEVINSLLDNAVRFTDEGEVRIALTRGGETDLVIEVKDTGRGIREEFREKLFEPFQDLGYLQERGFGAGMGLPIVKRYVEKLGGSVVLHRSDSSGSSFVVRLPILAARNNLLALPAEQPGTAAQPAAQKVLVVDDSFPGREVLKQMLASEGLSLEEAGNGLEAVEKARSFQPHLILMDLEMPIMDGFEATRRIKSEMPVQILAISASIFDDDVQRAYESGVDGFIEKPYRLDNVLGRIKSMLAENMAVDHGEVNTALIGRAMRSLPNETRELLVNHLASADLSAFRKQLHESGADGNVRLMIEKMLSAYQFEELAELLGDAQTAMTADQQSA